MGRTITAAGEYCATASAEMLRCRLYRHCWEPVYPPWQYDPPTPEVPYLTQPVVCPRCQSRSILRFDRALRPAGRTYEYADGYLYTAHEGPLRPDEVRQWLKEQHEGRPGGRKSRHLRAAG